MVLLLAVPLLTFSDSHTQLLEAAKNRNLSVVRTLLVGEKVYVNTVAEDGTTALHWAAHWNDLDMVDALISAGTHAGPANDYGVTPLWLACINKSHDMVEKLLGAGADPNATRTTGETVLMKCAMTGATRSVQALLDQGADVDAKELRKGQTALMWAAANGHSQIVKSLIESGADVSDHSNGGFTPLLFAAYSGDLDSARFLLDNKADINVVSTKQGNALLIASAGGHEALALFLLERGADPRAVDENGITALHHAVRSGFAALNGVRYDPVYRVWPANMPKLARALLDAGADPNAQINRQILLGPDGSPFNMPGSTPFMLAAISADTELMKMMKEHGADPHIIAAGGTTSLMAAARAACTGSCAFQGGNKANKEEIELSLQAVKLAAEMGVDVNAANEEGRTALHMAAFTGADPVVQYLVDHGANVNVSDKNGETPWSMASGISPGLRYRGLYGSHESTAALLVKLGAEIVSLEEMDPAAQHNQ